MRKLVAVATCAALVSVLSCGCGRGQTDRGAPTPPRTPAAAPVITGTAYYVAPDGNDSNPGTLDSPWKTIQHATETLQAGDGVYLRNGTYNEHVRIEVSGEGGTPIVYAAYEGETPIIDGTGVDESQNGMIIIASYVRLHGITVRNWDENAVWMEGAAFVDVTDCEVYDVCYGIGVSDGTHDFLLQNVVMHDFDLYGFDASPSGGADCYNGTLIDCVAHSGRDPEQNVDGFALGHADQYSFTLTRCVAYDVFDGFDISADDVVLDRCAAYDCGYAGYKLWGDNVTLVNCLGYGSAGSNAELDWSEDPKTVTLRNCTFFGGETYNIWVENSSDSLHMYNCILAGNNGIGLAFEQMGVDNYEGDNNLFHNANPERAIVVGYEDEFSLDQVAAGAWTSYCGKDRNSIVVSDLAGLFFDPAGRDFRLAGDSPAVDSGTEVESPAEDYQGNPRPVGAGFDIGAYEEQ